MSEASWRQLVLGGVHVSGRWVAREARRPQLLAMAAALDEETLTSMAQRLEATDEEVASARSRVRVLDGAEEDILRSRHLAPSEKLHLLEALRALRQPPGGAQRAELG
jgi:hypothetical protein